MDVVTIFQFTIQIRTVNPSGIVVCHIIDFAVPGDDHHVLDFGTGVIAAKRILEGFYLLSVVQINFSKEPVNCFTVLPGRATAAALAV